MAKKVRRAKKKQQKAKSDSGAGDATQVAAKGTQTAVARSSQSTEEQFHEEYAYVIKDLRQVLLLSAVMFVLLIALNLLLN